MTARATGLLLLTLTLAAAGCSEHQETTGPSEGEVVEVEIMNFAFSAPVVTVEAGTTVRWTNTTTSFHTVTPDGHDAWEEWQTSGQGESFEVRFDEAGSYDYFCSPHLALGMTGRVVVR